MVLLGKNNCCFVTGDDGSFKAYSHMVLRVLLEGVLRMNSYKVLDWIHFANTTSSAKWEHTFSHFLLLFLFDFISLYLSQANCQAPTFLFRIPSSLLFTESRNVCHVRMYIFNCMRFCGSVQRLSSSFSANLLVVCMILQGCCYRFQW